MLWRRTAPEGNGRRHDRSLAFYISYCNATAHETAFVERMSRRYKDGRRDLSWLNRAKYAELCGHVEVLLAPICAEHAQR